MRIAIARVIRIYIHALNNGIVHATWFSHDPFFFLQAQVLLDSTSFACRNCRTKDLNMRALPKMSFDFMVPDTFKVRVQGNADPSAYSIWDHRVMFVFCKLKQRNIQYAVTCLLGTDSEQEDILNMMQHSHIVI